MDPWTIAALLIVVAGGSYMVAPEATKSAGRWVAGKGWRGTGFLARSAGAKARPAAAAMGGRIGGLAGSTRARLGRWLQLLADTGRTSGNPAKPQSGPTLLDRAASTVRGKTATAPAPPAPKPAANPTARPTPPPAPAAPIERNFPMSDVTRNIVRAFDQLAEVEPATLAEVEHLYAELSVMWSRVGHAYEQFITNQEQAGVDPRPLRPAYNSLDDVAALATGSRDTRMAIRNFYEAYFDQLEGNAKTPKVGLLDPAKGREAA